MIPFEKFYGRFKDVTSDFLIRLDRNFDKLARPYEPYAVTTTGFEFSPTDFIDSVQADATSAALTVYLPEQPVGSRRRRVIKTDSSANVVTVDGNGNNINGGTTYVLSAQYEFVEVEPTGTEWLIVGYG